MHVSAADCGRMELDMIYEILLVDDEPIILSGIKFLIDWETHSFHIAGTARNGQQALEAIDTLRPHIVICDINMPVMSGLELLRCCNNRQESPVFIMLTNYGEFNLAIEAMRCRAVDYLLKTNLEPDTLLKSLEAAKTEYERRGGLARVQMADSYIRSNRSHMIAGHLKKLLNGSTASSEWQQPFLEENALDRCCLLHLVMDFSELYASSPCSHEDNNRLFQWEQEVIEKLAGNLFSHYSSLDPDGQKQSLVLFSWNVSGELSTLVTQFYNKLQTVSSNITLVRLSVLATGIFSGQEGLEQAILQYRQLNEYYYHYEKEILFAEELKPLSLEPLSYGDLISKLVPALRTRNIEHCNELIKQAIKLTAGSYHHRTDAIRECTSLYSTVSSILIPMLPDHTSNEYFTDTSSTIHRISCLCTRSAVCGWLSELKQQIIRQLEQLHSSKSDLAEKARNYVIENVDKRIMLQDAADYVNLSASYLSALFKKEYQQNFVDFINETKMERACELIRENKYWIYEISYMLGFDNAYYFTKVFKKHTGLTPTEYQRKMRQQT